MPDSKRQAVTILLPHRLMGTNRTHRPKTKSQTSGCRRYSTDNAGRRQPLESSTGLGTALIAALAKQLDAVISEESTSRGLTVDVTRASFVSRLPNARDTSYIVAIIGALFLAVAGVAWWRIAKKPDEDPPTEKNIKRGGSAAMIIVIAFLLSAVAAGFAVFGWFQR